MPIFVLININEDILYANLNFTTTSNAIFDFKYWYRFQKKKYRLVSMQTIRIKHRP